MVDPFYMLYHFLSSFCRIYLEPRVHKKARKTYIYGWNSALVDGFAIFMRELGLKPFLYSGFIGECIDSSH